MNNTVKWLSYEFTVYLHGMNWNPVAGIYIFAGTTPKNQWQALYVGQNAKFSERIPGHEIWDTARSLGATHVHAMAVPLAANRDIIEAELILAFDPPLNRQQPQI